MARAAFAALVGLFLPLCVAGGPPLLCTFNVSNSTSHTEKFENVTLPSNYKITVRYTDWRTNVTALVVESKLGSSFRVQKTTKNALTNILVIPNITVTFNDSSCNASKSSELPIIYALPKEVNDLFSFRGTSLSELIVGILKKNLTNQHIEKNTVIVGGIEADQWVGCDKSDGSQTFIQVLINYATKLSIPPYSPRIENPLPLVVQITMFNATDNSTLSDASFDIVELDIATTNDEFSLPHGLYCEGMTQQSLPISFPSKFEASLDYRSVSGKASDIVDLVYDGEERVVSFRVNVTLDRDLPLVSNVSTPTGSSAITVIHDFNYGLEYRLLSDASVCSQVSAIDSSFGDVAVNSSTGEIDVKAPEELIAFLKGSDFYNAGKRSSDVGPPLQVFVSRSLSQKGHTVTEVLFFDDSWLFSIVPGFPIHSIIHYHKNESGVEIERSKIHVRSFKNMTTSGTRWMELSLYPCLKVADESYLYVNVKNASLSAMEKIGRSRVESAIGEAIAKTANISVLRISDFYFKEMEKDVMVAFFVIGEKSGEKPANSTRRLDELSLHDAISSLNQTLMDRDIAVPVFGSGEMKLSRSSLGQIPPQWNHSQPSIGYTGGSMFVLAVFMLLLGVGIGVGVTFFMWKRQRLAGLAYQVFE